MKIKLNNIGLEVSCNGNGQTVYYLGPGRTSGPFVLKEGGIISERRERLLRLALEAWEKMTDNQKAPGRIPGASLRRNKERPNITQKKAIKQHDAIQIVIIDKRIKSVMVYSFCIMIYAKTMQHFMAVENDKKSDNYLKWTD
jgi:hypothetical protein